MRPPSAAPGRASAPRWHNAAGAATPRRGARLAGASLGGSPELPLGFAVVGGAVGFHPASRLALSVLGHPDGQGLSRIAAAVGLAQNFAALLAPVTGRLPR